MNQKPKKFALQMLDTTRPEDLSTHVPSKCISAAQKFVIPVPAYDGGGEPLVFPSGHDKVGQPITDWQGQPIGEKGLVFYNAKDKVVQAVAGDGNGIVIINQVDAEKAAQLTAKIEELGGDPSKFTLTQTKELLGYAESIGLSDQYNSDKTFMNSKLTPVSGSNGFGLFKRDDRDLCDAFLMEAEGLFQGPAAEPQPFNPGDVIVRQPDGKGGSTWRKVDGAVFAQTYTNPSGGPVFMLKDGIPSGRLVYDPKPSDKHIEVLAMCESIKNSFDKFMQQQRG